MEESENRESFPEENRSNPDTPEKKRNGARPPFYIPAFVWLTMVFFIGMVLGNLLWLGVADVLAFGRENQSVEITISAADSMADIADTLADNGLISYPWLFRLYAGITGAGGKIKPGTYALNRIWDYPALVRALGA